VSVADSLGDFELVRYFESNSIFLWWLFFFHLSLCPSPCIDLSIHFAVDKVDANSRKGGRLLQPPTPISRGDNWPSLPVQKTTLEDLEAAEAKEGGGAGGAAAEDAGGLQEASAHSSGVGAAATGGGGAEWDGDEDFGDTAMEDDVDLDFDDDDGGGGWGDDLDDLGDDFGDDHAKKEPVDDMADLKEMGEDAGNFQMPKAGRPPAACWVENSSHAAVHIAAGGASSAMQLLNRQIAASDFAVLKKSMIGSYLGSMASLPGVPGSGSMSLPLLRNDADGHPGNASLPRTSLKMKNLVAGIRSGYRFFQGGKFNDSRASFASVLADIPLVVAESKTEADEMKEMLEICREYITAVRIRGEMAASASDPARSTELSAYFTRCNLQPTHLLLALRSAMGTSFKNKNFIAAAGFARRLLELPEMSSEKNKDLRTKASKVLQKSEQMGKNQHELRYDENTTFTIDCKDFVPIYQGDTSVTCSYCGSSYQDESMKGKACLTCNFSAVGVSTIGLVTGS